MVAGVLCLTPVLPASATVHWKDAQRRLKQEAEEETKGKAASQTLHEISTNVH